jgi:hypothetical protein
MDVGGRRRARNSDSSECWQVCWWTGGITGLAPHAGETRILEAEPSSGSLLGEGVLRCTEICTRTPDTRRLKGDPA